MTAWDFDILSVVCQTGLLILAAAMLIALYRVVRGPRHADRIIALDLISMLVVAMASLYAVYSGHEAFLDVAIAYALVAFLGTVAFARYIERTAAARPEARNSARKGEEDG